MELKTVRNGTKSQVTLFAVSHPTVTFGIGEDKDFDDEDFKTYEKAITSVNGIDKEFRVIKKVSQEAPIKNEVQVVEVVEELPPLQQAEKELADAEEYLASLPPKARKVTLDSAAQRVEVAKAKYLKLYEAATDPEPKWLDEVVSPST